jgi:hypothetical protein
MNRGFGPCLIGVIMHKTIDFADHVIKLYSYQAAGKDYFNAYIQVYPRCGVRTPNLNWFGCCYPTLIAATNELRKLWSLKRKEYENT